MGKDNKIFQARRAAGLSRADMERELKIPARTIEDWESGKRTPPEYVETLVIEKLRRMEIKNDLKNGARNEAHRMYLEKMDYLDGVAYLLSCGYKRMDSVTEKVGKTLFISECYKITFQPGDFEYKEGKDNSHVVTWEYKVPDDVEETTALKWDNGYWHVARAMGE